MGEYGNTRFPFRLCRPLLYLAALGIVVFLLYKWGTSKPDTREILVSRAHIEGLRQEYLQKTGSLPGPDEEKALIQKFVDNEVLVREAREMGLDQGDPIVRRRLIQKMEFLLEDFYMRNEPTEAELQEFYERRSESFVKPERFSLTHVFLDRGRSTDPLDLSVSSLIEKLSDGTDPSKLGDPFVLGSRFQQRTRKELAAIFGSPFAEAVSQLPEGVWSGPVESSYGHHLVRIESGTEARQPGLEEVRYRVLKKWKAEQRASVIPQEVRRLRDRYDIRCVEGNTGNPDTKGPGSP